MLQIELREGSILERRLDPRYGQGTTFFPLFGSKEQDDENFEYLLFEKSLHGVKIALSGWAISRSKLKMEINLTCKKIIKIIKEIIN